jgi:hypothetical protein
LVQANSLPYEDQNAELIRWDVVLSSGSTETLFLQVAFCLCHSEHSHFSYQSLTTQTTWCPWQLLKKTLVGLYESLEGIFAFYKQEKGCNTQANYGTLRKERSFLF